MSNADRTGRGNGPAPDLLDAHPAAAAPGRGGVPVAVAASTVRGGAEAHSTSAIVPGGDGDRDHHGRRMLRWECQCNRRPVLLATIESSGRVNIKLRDRYLRITGGRIEATCPRCGVQHLLAAGELA